MSDEKSIHRRDLPAVVRRAAALAASTDDVDDELPEQEVIRIAAELGLAERHVRQALYEGVREEAEPGFLDRQLGAPRFQAARAVPFQPDHARRAIEDYLTTCEYMRTLRQQSISVSFVPAEDAMSKLARGFNRRHTQLCRAANLEVAIRPLEAGWSHVRLRMVYADDRRRRISSGVVIGTILGLPAAGLVTVIVAGLLTSVLGAGLATAAGGVGGIAAFSGVMFAQFASIRAAYRRWRERTQHEAEGLLDRLEKGDDLRPPPPPWLRKLQMKLGL